MVPIRDATFPQKPITGTALNHRIASNYRQLLADYGSLPANYQPLCGFDYNGYFPRPGGLPTRLVFLPQITADN